MSVWRRTHVRSESGQGLVELIVALTILAVGIGALLTVLTSSALSLQRSDRMGTALTLAEKQLELYRNLSFSDIRLDHNALAGISGTDPYMTANASDATIPSGLAANQGTDTAAGKNACPTGPPPECSPIQNIATSQSPDHRAYRVDTYITSVTPKDSGGVQIGDPVDQVFVVVRDAAIATLPILARTSSTFSAID